MTITAILTSLLWIFVGLLFLALFLYAARYIIEWFAPPEPAKRIIYVIIGLLALIWLIGLFTGHGPIGPVLPFR